QPAAPRPARVARPTARRRGGPVLTRGPCMLPEQLRLLVAAYSAGDLPPRRRSAAERLLRHSAEARVLLRDLETNVERLRNLPRQTLPADFADRVLRALPPEPEPIIRLAAVPRPGGDRVARAARYAIAAAVV